MKYIGEFDGGFHYEYMDCGIFIHEDHIHFVGAHYDENIELSPVVLLYIIQQYQEHFGPIKIEIINEWKGIQGSMF